MKSSTGQHFIALDQIRALAAFLVFAWHFIHGEDGHPVPFDQLSPFFPLSLLSEGHTGVALFMTLSGYLFAKLLDGRRVDYHAFFTNRCLRLLPLLLLVILIEGIREVCNGAKAEDYFSTLVDGIYLPTLPCGGWSITVEFHFYILLPILLWINRKSRFLPVALVGAVLLLRTWLFHRSGEIQSLAFWTIIGRIDQFTLGIIFFTFRQHFTRKHLFAGLIFGAFMFFYWRFDAAGGFYNIGQYPSSSSLWIFMPTIEGIAYGVLVAWYDNSFTQSAMGLSGFIGRLGAYSYSIYLLHFFIVFHAASFIDQHVIRLGNFYIACACALFAFLGMYPLGYLSFRFIESPFLKRRKPYLLDSIGRTVAG